MNKPVVTITPSKDQNRTDQVPQQKQQKPQQTQQPVQKPAKKSDD